MPLSVLYFVFAVMLVPIPNFAYRGKAIGESCMYDLECRSPETSICYNREECRCKTNYTLETKSGNCIPVCTSDNGCPHGINKCSATVCKCDKHFIKLDEICVKRKKVNLGEKCNDIDDCYETKTSEVQCLNSICACGNGYRHVGNNICLFGDLGEPCNGNNECNTFNNSLYCYQGTCQCKNNYIKSHSSNTCLKLGKLGEVCEEHQQCFENNSECFHLKCQCKKGYRMENNECIRNADLGENCTTNIECNPLNGATHCSNGVCDCKVPEYIKSTRRLKSCVILSKYGTFCEEMKQCPGDSKCIKGKCQCGVGYHWNYNMTCEQNSAYLLKENLWALLIMVFIFLVY